MIRVMKRLPGMAVSFFLVLSLLAAGCSQSLQARTPAEERPPAETPPASPFTVDVSFPNGAPPLNREAELRTTVRTLVNLTGMSVEIRLPTGLELVSGELSWTGDIPAGELKVIGATVRAVETGNWTIEVRRDLDPARNGGLGMRGSAPVYVSIFDNSAEWGITPPWYEKGSFEVPVQPAKASN